MDIIPAIGQWSRKHIEKLAKDNPSIGITKKDSDAKALVKVWDKVAKSAKKLPATVSKPDDFVETLVDFGFTAARNIWVLPASYYTAVNTAVTKVAEDDDLAKAVVFVQEAISKGIEGSGESAKK